MADKEIIGIIHYLLKNRARWYIDIYCPEITEIQEACERAKLFADKELSKLSLSELYGRYKKWHKGEPIIDPNIGHFVSFLNQVIYDLGRSSLEGMDKQYFEENCVLSFHFIS